MSTEPILDSAETAPPQPVNASHEGNAPSASPSPESNAADAFFRKGGDYLHGRGVAKDEGMAAASFLDASDLGHEAGTIMSSLLYYIGVGVTRNTQTAGEYAQKYLLSEPQGRHAGMAQEIIDGSLGTENARRILYGRAAQTQGAASNGKGTGPRKNILLGGVAAFVAVLAIAGGVLYAKRDKGGLPDDVSSTAPLISNEERDAAKREALAIAASLKAEAMTAIKKADDESNAKKAADAAAAEEQRLAKEKAVKDEEAARAAQAQAAQEAQAAQAAQAQARAAQVQSQGQVQPRGQISSAQLAQLKVMYASSVDAMRHGQYDRASAIADQMLSMDPNSMEIRKLKNAILQASGRR